MAIESDKEAMERSAQFVEEFLKENGTSFKDKIIYEKNVSYYEGLEEGRAMARAKGERIMAISIAQSMLLNNEDVSKISKYTNLTIEEIEALNKN